MATNMIGQDMSNWLWNATDPNTAFNSYDPVTGKWSQGSLNGWTRDQFQDSEFVGMTEQLANYLRAAGYTGDFKGQGSDSILLNYGGGREALSALDDAGGIKPDDLRIKRNPELDAWLQQQGLTLQQGVQHTPGGSQQTWIQRLVGADGKPVVVDAFNDRYSAGDRFTNLVQAGLAAATAAGAGHAAGAWDLGAASGGAGGLAPAGSGAGMAGGGMVPAEFTALPGVDAAAGSVAEALGGSNIIGGLAETFTMPTLTSQSISSGLVSGLSNLSPLAASAGLAGAGGGLGEILSNYGGKALSGVKAAADMVGGGQNLAAIVGGLAGGAGAGGSDTSSVQNRIDPRMAQYLYGTGYGDKSSLLGAAQDWWKQNQSGMNPTMQQGIDQLKALYGGPEYQQGYTQMRSVGQGLLNTPVAGNPFMQGGGLMPTYQHPGGGGLLPQAGQPAPSTQIPKIQPPWSI